MKRKHISFTLVIIQVLLVFSCLFTGCQLFGTSYDVIYDTENKYYTVVGKSTAMEGQDYTFTIEVKNGYAPAENFTVFVNNEAVVMNGMSYTVKNVSGDITISARNFVEKKYEVKFIAGDMLMQSSQLKYGELPKYEKKGGYYKDYTEDMVGIFTGWSLSPDGPLTDIQTVSGDTDYYAKILKMQRYAYIQDVMDVHYTAGTQQGTWTDRLSLYSLIYGDLPYDGKFWGLIGEYDNGEVCLEYTLDWEPINFQEVLGEDKAFVFAFSPNYTDFIMQIEGKLLSIDYKVYVAKIYGGALYINDEKFVDLDESVYNGTKPMLWTVTRSLVDTYAMIGVSDIGIVEI